MHSYWECQDQGTDQGTSCICPPERWQGESHLQLHYPLFPLWENVSLEDGDGDAHDPCRKTLALWGGRWKEELRKGQKSVPDFFSSLSNEKTDGVMEGKIVRLQRDLCDRKVLQKCSNSSCLPQAKTDTWSWNLIYTSFKHKYKVDMLQTSVSVRGVHRRTAGHVCLQATLGCVLKRWINIRAVWKKDGIKKCGNVAPMR